MQSHRPTRDIPSWTSILLTLSTTHYNVRRSKRSKGRRGVRRVRLSADGAGVVSHAGVGMLREVAHLTGLIGSVTEVLADTYQGPWVHEPGRVFADLAVGSGRRRS
jgi:hypothetical protein